MAHEMAGANAFERSPWRGNSIIKRPPELLLAACVQICLDLKMVHTIVSSEIKMDNTAFLPSRYPSSPSSLSFSPASSLVSCPPAGNEPQWFGKRGRDGQRLTFFSAHCITQEEDDNSCSDGADDQMMQDVVSGGPCKRARTSFADAISSTQDSQHQIPEVLLPNSTCDDFENSSMSFDSSNFSAPSTNINSNIIPWWKQTKKFPPKSITRHNKAGLSCVCCVCQVVFDPNSTGKNSKEEPDTIMPANSLLAYFSPRRKHDHSSSSARKRISTPSSGSCSDTVCPSLPGSKSGSSVCKFCERMACPSCMVDCDDCRHIFCTFCVSKDYSGAYERTLCADCGENQVNSNVSTSTTYISNDSMMVIDSE